MRLKSQLGALLLSTCLLAAACAGSESASQARDTSAAESAEPVQGDQHSTGSPASETPGVRRELALALQPESDVPTNLLPPIEVHDVGQDRMVNFRNIFPAERPVLLWMWAPY